MMRWRSRHPLSEKAMRCGNSVREVETRDSTSHNASACRVCFCSYASAKARKSGVKEVCLLYCCPLCVPLFPCLSPAGFW